MSRRLAEYMSPKVVATLVAAAIIASLLLAQLLRARATDERSACLMRASIAPGTDAESVKRSFGEPDEDVPRDQWVWPGDCDGGKATHAWTYRAINDGGGAMLFVYFDAAGRVVCSENVLVAI
jgi:hypothetical protein